MHQRAIGAIRDAGVAPVRAAVKARQLQQGKGVLGPAGWLHKCCWVIAGVSCGVACVVYSVSCSVVCARA